MTSWSHAARCFMFGGRRGFGLHAAPLLGIAEAPPAARRSAGPRIGAHPSKTSSTKPAWKEKRAFMSTGMVSPTTLAPLGLRLITDLELGQPGVERAGRGADDVPVQRSASGLGHADHELGDIWLERPAARSLPWAAARATCPRTRRTLGPARSARARRRSATAPGDPGRRCGCRTSSSRSRTRRRPGRRAGRPGHGRELVGGGRALVGGVAHHQAPDGGVADHERRR